MQAMGSFLLGVAVCALVLVKSTADQTLLLPSSEENSHYYQPVGQEGDGHPRRSLSQRSLENEVQAPTTTATRVLKLLVVLPLSSEDSQERGLEMLPAAKLALDQVNNRTDLLRGFRLELVPLDSSSSSCTCGGGDKLTSFLVNVFRELQEEKLAFVAGPGRDADRSINGRVVGIVGLPLSTNALALARLTAAAAGSHGSTPASLAAGAAEPGSGGGEDASQSDRLGLFQVYLSPSPLLQNFSHVRQLFPPSSVYADVAFELLEALDRQRIGVVYSGAMDAYHLPTAEAFLSKAKKTDPSRLEVVFAGQLVPGRSAQSLLQDIKMHGVKIAFVSLPLEEAVIFLCATYYSGLRWPEYLWMFHDLDLSDLQAFPNQHCSDGGDMLAKAVEGAVLLNYNFKTSTVNELMISGITYSTYHEYYLQYLQEHQKISTTDNPVANALYDSVWAVTLSLNKSLQQHHASGLDGPPEVSVSFQGATGPVSLDSSGGSTFNISVHQVLDHTVVLLGHYDSMSRLTMMEQYLNSSEFPSDKLNEEYLLLSHLVAIILLALNGLLLLLTTVVLLLFLYFRNDPEIKATSPYLSLLMFLGCYLLLVNVFLEVVFRVVVSEQRYGALICNVIFWPASLGLNLIFATLLVRLVRIYHIFTHVKKTRKAWNDCHLFIAVLLIMLGNLLLLVLWAAMDAYHIESETFYIEAVADGHPYYLVQQYCYSSYVVIWLLLVCGYSVLLIVLVLIMAVKTRRIKRRDFKDTKKVSVYIFMTIVLICMVIPLWWISRWLSYTASGLFLCLGYALAASLCQILLFLPKVMMPLLRRLLGKQWVEAHMSVQDSSTFGGFSASIRRTRNKMSTSTI